MPDDLNSLVDTLLGEAAKVLLRDEDFGKFLQWGDRTLPSLLGYWGSSPLQTVGAEYDQTQDDKLIGLMARSLYAAMPLPSRGFRSIQLVLPERHEACCCGSGQQFKDCCAPLAEALPPFHTELCVGPMLLSLGKGAWAGLPDAHMPVDLVWSVAYEWLMSGRATEVVRLLAPWLPAQGPIPDERADLLDMLGDAYADLSKPRKRKELAQAMIARGGPVVQSKGWQRVALMSCDAGQYAAAHEAFKAAQRLVPDDPDLSILELSLLIGEGDVIQLRERADFWVRSLSRRNKNNEFDGLIETVRDMGVRGNEMLLEVAERHNRA